MKMIYGWLGFVRIGLKPGGCILYWSILEGSPRIELLRKFCFFVDVVGEEEE